MLGIGDEYSRCGLTREVDKWKDQGGVGMEGSRNKHNGCMGGGIRALGGTRRMGWEKTSGGQ